MDHKQSHSPEDKTNYVEIDELQPNVNIKNSSQSTHCLTEKREDFVTIISNLDMNNFGSEFSFDQLEVKQIIKKKSIGDYYTTEEELRENFIEDEIEYNKTTSHKFQEIRILDVKPFFEGNTH